MGSTERILEKMFKENTGRHMLDSGGAYGRNWERNQTRHFKDEPEGTLEFSVHEHNGETYGELLSYVSTYHFLCKKLEYDSAMQKKFDRFCNRKSNEDECWLALAERFPKEVIGAKEIVCVNTYNHDNLLDQVIQYVYWDDDDGGHVLLQIHGGCDVRGGYTKPRCFSAELCEINEDGHATITCTGWKDNKQQPLPHVPDVDDGNHWWDAYDGVHFESGRGVDLNSYDFTDDESKKGEGMIYVDEDGNGYCPICGGKLEICI